MSICGSTLGKGLGGAISKASKALGGSLGLLGAVDLTSELITGYGLFELLTVPYIECPDGSFVSALEWYGNGMKCKENPTPPSVPGSSWSPPGSSNSASQNKTIKALQDYKNSLPEGSILDATFGATFMTIVRGGAVIATQVIPGHLPIGGGFHKYKWDQSGNKTLISKFLQNSGGTGAGYDLEIGLAYCLPGSLGFDPNLGPGDDRDAYRVYTYGSGSTPGYDLEYLINRIETDQFNLAWGLVGVDVTLPSGAQAPKFTIGPGLGGEPTNNDRKEDCNEVSNCPCLTEAAIVRAVKKAFGIDLPLMPEQAILNMGKRIFGGISGKINLGKSVTPIVPSSLLDAITALIAVSHFRNGLHRYPMVMPRSLIDDGIVANTAPDFIHENAELWEWWIKQFDAMMGEFPIDIKIKNGNSETPLKFENLAEALAELSGLIIQTATDADAAVNVGSRAVVEASKAGNAAIIAQRHALALIEFLGIKTDGEQIPVQSTITPGKLDQANNTNDGHGLKEFLQPSTQYVSVLKEVDEFDLKAVLQRLLQNSEIVRAAHWQEYNPEKPGKNKVTGDYIRDQRRYDKSQANEGTLALKKEMEAKFNKEGSPVKIDIDRVLSDGQSVEIPGSNFVIRRQSPST